MLKTKILIQESSMNVIKEHIAALEIQVKRANVMFAAKAKLAFQEFLGYFSKRCYIHLRETLSFH
jgi:hypothetical protein